MRLFWLFIAICGVVWVLVMLALLYGIFPRSAAQSADPLRLDAAQERRSALAVGGLTVATAIVLVFFTIISFLGSRGLNASSDAKVEIEVTGHQWWWSVRYVDPDPSKTFTTANEIRVPVGQPVKAKLVADDVIHSFWVPNLSGKKDLIPGQHNELIFTAARSGVYRGQCAEFCGDQHARMGLRVVAESPEDFALWRARQLEPARSMDDPAAQNGEQIFLKNGCGLCHTIRGTAAGGRLGPDLTHVGSRQAIAADALPNSVGNIAGWIADPQAVKPGNHMPRVPLGSGELNALAHYLAGLQ